MAYKTYITEALVCGSKPSNTSDRSYLLFTREAGMLYATAKSVREERSKQRFSLQEFSYLRATLVHGKTGWRLTGTEPILNVYALKETREARGLVRNIIRLLRRLLQGEAPHAALFEDVMDFMQHGEYPPNTEEVMTLRILHALGYVAPTPAVEALIAAPSVFAGVGALKQAMLPECRELIERALSESQL